MSNFVSLEEAAKKLGVSVDELVDMRSRGEIFGYRDGGSWKFKPEEIERVASEMMGGDALDEDPAGSSILVSESELGSASKHGSTIGSDVLATEEGSDIDSDVELVADPGSGSDVRLVANQGGVIGGDKVDSDLSLSGESGDELSFVDSEDGLQLPDSDDDQDELSLAAEDGSDIVASASSDLELSGGSELDLGGSELNLAGSDATPNLSGGSEGASDIPLGSDLELASEEPSGVLDSDAEVSLDGGSPGSGLIQGDSDPDIAGAGSDLELTDDGDLVLGGGSDLALGTDSGINLMSPADSGISLEDEPLDLAASGISGLDLAMEGSGSDVAGSASGSAVDFQQDEEFQLSPSGSLDADDDSGSQVIELEDSSEFGDAAVAIPAEEGFDAFADVDGGGGLDEPSAADALGAAAPAAAATSMASPEVSYSIFQVGALLGILTLMCMSGILVTDVVRNMWAWSESDSDLTSGFTSMILSVFGG